MALVLAMVLALGTFSFAAAAPLKDVVGTDCEDAVERLVALDIIAGYPDGTFKPEQPVTRAEFAKIMVSALGIGEAANYAAGPTRFPDVTAGHWASGYINVAVDVGIIVGYPDGTFKPENQVTFAEAIKMIVAGLGYTPKANALGGYPGGYLAVAAEEGITKDVNVVSTLSANRGAIAMMIDNALEVDLMEQVSYGDSPEWKTIKGKTLLNSKLDVEEVEGTVVAISKTDKLDENEFFYGNSPNKDRQQKAFDAGKKSNAAVPDAAARGPHRRGPFRWKGQFHPFLYTQAFTETAPL
jgi:predicted DNA-binding antitoxin AbrB/MazE fold protein